MTSHLHALPDADESSTVTRSIVTRGGSMSPLSARRLETARKQDQALLLRGYGLTFEAIARELGYAGRQPAQAAVRAALKRRSETAHAEYVALVDARLDQYLLNLSARIERGEPRAIEVALQVEARRAAMLGLDAPKRVEITEATLEEEVQRLRAELGPLEAQAQLPAGHKPPQPDIVEGELVEEEG